MITAIADKELNQVVGSDYGDGKRDNGATPRYKVGQDVEVYNFDFHITTTRRRIIEVEEYKSDPIFGKPFRWSYYVEDALGHKKWVNANSIQSA